MSDYKLELIQQWEEMNNKTELELENSAKFYKEKLMPLSIDSFIKNSIDKKKENYKYMILSVGTSFEPLVLSLKLWKPEKVLFLCTKQTESQLDSIFEYIDLKPSQYDKSIVDSTKILSIYQEIKKKYFEWGKPEKLIVDPTGGTKAMTAATAMAGYILNATLVYVAGSDYSKKHRRPIPGSEYLEYIDNPLKEFGDLEKEKADDLFNHSSYFQAKEKYEYLKDLIHVKNKNYKGMFLLSGAYEAWDNLQFNKAAQYAEELLIFINENERYDGVLLFNNVQEKIVYQMTLVNDMNRIIDESNKQVAEYSNKNEWMFMLFTGANRRACEGKYDMAILLLYRTLELIMQMRLSEYNINVSQPDYSKLPKVKSLREYEDEYSRKWKSAHGNRVNRFKSSRTLPSPLSMMGGYVLLAVLKDSIIGKNSNSFLNQLYVLNKLRNNSVFAHGFNSISKSEYHRYYSFVKDRVNDFCIINNIEVTNEIDKITFIQTNDID